MAQEAAMRTYLRDIIGVTDTTGPNPAARRIAIQEEGLSVLVDLLEFDESGIKTLCASVRKPGGMIVDPNDPNRQIVDPGYHIPAICEKRLKWAAYGARIYQMVGREINYDSLNRLRLKAFERHSILMTDHEDPEKLPVVSKTFGIVKAMDLVPGHLRDRLGSRNIPLSYIIRDEVTPPALRPLKLDDCVGEEYSSLAEELVIHTPHVGSEYVEDNTKVFQIIQDMVQGTSFESSIKSFQRSRNGRGAYRALCQHNLGSSKWDKIIEEAETYVMKREWNGKNYRFTLRNHINKHREAHNEMMRASQFVEYELPNEHTRVGRLIKSIVNRDPSIVSAVTHIQGNTEQRNDFELAADFLLLTAPKLKENPQNHRISAIKAQKNQKHGLGKSGVEFRYHSRQEYHKLNKAQKKELSEWRKGKDRSKDNTPTSHQVSVLQQQVTEMREQAEIMRATIASLTTRDASDAPRQPLTNPLNQRSN